MSGTRAAAEEALAAGVEGPGSGSQGPSHPATGTPAACKDKLKHIPIRDGVVFVIHVFTSKPPCRNLNFRRKH